MRENYRNSIERINKFPQFTTMNVIDGQAGLIICASLIFYSLTIDNILNIIVLLILAGISISMLSGDNGILQKATDAKQTSERADAKEQAQMDILAWITDKTSNHEDASLDDTKVREILNDNKSYVKEAKESSFITSKGEYEIPYSELYTAKETIPTNPIPTSNSDLDKLKLYFKDKRQSEILDGLSFLDNNELGIKGEDLGTSTLLGPPTEADDGNYYFYIQVNYNDKLYKVKGIAFKTAGSENIYTDDIVEIP